MRAGEESNENSTGITRGVLHRGRRRSCPAPEDQLKNKIIFLEIKLLGAPDHPKTQLNQERWKDNRPLSQSKEIQALLLQHAQFPKGTGPQPLT